jgi:hypothetical protein
MRTTLALVAISGIDHWSREGNLERFGMGVDDCNATLLICTIGDTHSLFQRGVPHIVGIFSDIERVQKFETVSVVNSELSVCPVGEEKPIELTSVHNALRCGSAGDAVYVPAGKCIHDFDRVVAQSCAYDTLAFRTESEVIDPPSNIRQWNLLD